VSRYRGPRIRILRRLGSELPGLTTKTAARRPTPPGHAAAIARRMPRPTEYALRLREKQKLKHHYGLTERQLRRVYREAQRMAGDTGRNMLNLLESRLDNLVWRAGMTRTIPAARQLVTHGHVNVGEKRARTPSQTLNQGQSFTLREKLRNREDVRLSVNNPVIDPPQGLQIDLDKLSVTIDSLPTVEELPVDIDIQKVIEFYSR